MELIESMTLPPISLISDPRIKTLASIYCKARVLFALIYGSHTDCLPSCVLKTFLFLTFVHLAEIAIVRWLFFSPNVHLTCSSPV